jgi:hypothetical protein
MIPVNNLDFMQWLRERGFLYRAINNRPMYANGGGFIPGEICLCNWTGYMYLTGGMPVEHLIIYSNDDNSERLG